MLGVDHFKTINWINSLAIGTGVIDFMFSGVVTGNPYPVVYPV
jgi:hypothetical protein